MVVISIIISIIISRTLRISVFVSVVLVVLEYLVVFGRTTDYGLFVAEFHCKIVATIVVGEHDAVIRARVARARYAHASERFECHHVTIAVPLVSFFFIYLIKNLINISFNLLISLFFKGL